MSSWISLQLTKAVRRTHKEIKIKMKKLMTLMLGLAFLSGTVAMSFAQEHPADQKTEKKKGGKKKGGKKKTDETKKEG